MTPSTGMGLATVEKGKVVITIVADEDQLDRVLREDVAAKRHIHPDAVEIVYDELVGNIAGSTDCHCGGECPTCKKAKVKTRNRDSYPWEPVDEGPAENVLVVNVAGSKKSFPSATLKMSPAKACKILHDKTVHGRPLTTKQRGMFGAHCRKGKAVKNSDLPVAVNCGGKGGKPGPCPDGGVGRKVKALPSGAGRPRESEDHNPETARKAAVLKAYLDQTLDRAKELAAEYSKTKTELQRQEESAREARAADKKRRQDAAAAFLQRRAGTHGGQIRSIGDEAEKLAKKRKATEEKLARISGSMGRRISINEDLPTAVPEAEPAANWCNKYGGTTCKGGGKGAPAKTPPTPAPAAKAKRGFADWTPAEDKQALAGIKKVFESLAKKDPKTWPKGTKENVADLTKLAKAIEARQAKRKKGGKGKVATNEFLWDLAGRVVANTATDDELTVNQFNDAVMEVYESWGGETTSDNSSHSSREWVPLEG